MSTPIYVNRHGSISIRASSAEQYAVEPAVATQRMECNARAACRWLYERHDAEMLDQLQPILDNFEGRDDALMTALERRYGQHQIQEALNALNFGRRPTVVLLPASTRSPATRQDPNAMGTAERPAPTPTESNSSTQPSPMPNSPMPPREAARAAEAALAKLSLPVTTASSSTTTERAMTSLLSLFLSSTSRILPPSDTAAAEGTAKPKLVVKKSPPPRESGTSNAMSAKQKFWFATSPVPSPHQPEAAGRRKQLSAGIAETKQSPSNSAKPGLVLRPREGRDGATKQPPAAMPSRQLFVPQTTSERSTRGTPLAELEKYEQAQLERATTIRDGVESPRELFRANALAREVSATRAHDFVQEATSLLGLPSTQVALNATKTSTPLRQLEEIERYEATKQQQQQQQQQQGSWGLSDTVGIPPGIKREGPRNARLHAWETFLQHQDNKYAALESMFDSKRTPPPRSSISSSLDYSSPGKAPLPRGTEAQREMAYDRSYHRVLPVDDGRSLLNIPPRRGASDQFGISRWPSDAIRAHPSAPDPKWHQQQEPPPRTRGSNAPTIFSPSSRHHPAESHREATALPLLQPVLRIDELLASSSSFIPSDVRSPNADAMAVTGMKPSPPPSPPPLPQTPSSPMNTRLLAVEKKLDALGQTMSQQQQTTVILPRQETAADSDAVQRSQWVASRAVPSSSLVVDSPLALVMMWKDVIESNEAPLSGSEKPELKFGRWTQEASVKEAAKQSASAVMAKSASAPGVMTTIPAVQAASASVKQPASASVAQSASAPVAMGAIPMGTPLAVQQPTVKPPPRPPGKSRRASLAELSKTRLDTTLEGNAVPPKPSPRLTSTAAAAAAAMPMVPPPVVPQSERERRHSGTMVRW